MSTGVIVNDYEIRNWHTVSILELARARRKQVQPLPVEVQKKKPAKRSKDMPRAKRELSPEDKHIICNRYEKGKSVRELASQFHVGLPRIREVLAEGGVPTRKQGFNLMTTDDPEPYTAAPDTRVIQVHELKPYTRPQAFDLGSLIQPGNVVTIARAVQGLVNEMNTIPGVTASFRFGYELTAGAR